jgi:hypothetical protein
MQKVSEYQQNAAECRQKAAQTIDLKLKMQLEETAEVWERLARGRRQGIVENNPDQILAAAVFVSAIRSASRA